MSHGAYVERSLRPMRTPANPESPRVTVIVPVLNGERLIEGCLRALDAQTLEPSEYEIVVVDDGSSDGTRPIIERFSAGARARVRLVSRAQNGGPAAARNDGLAAARGSVIAFTDADVEVAPDWLHMALMRLDADPALTAVEGRTLPKGEKGTFTHQMENTRGQLYMTCNMVYRRDALRDGFDPRFRLAFLEDSDVAFRVLERGGRIEFAPEVVAHHLVLHEGRIKFWREARKRFYNPLLYKKHPSLYRRLLKPVVPAFPAPYVDYLLAVAVLATTLVTQAWVAAVPAALMTLWTFKRVAHVLRARAPLAMLQAALVPFVQTLWVLAGMIRFRVFSARM